VAEKAVKLSHRIDGREEGAAMEANAAEPSDSTPA
jgi:hypothetical protein